MSYVSDPANAPVLLAAGPVLVAAYDLYTSTAPGKRQAGSLGWYATKAVAPIAVGYGTGFVLVRFAQSPVLVAGLAGTLAAYFLAPYLVSLVAGDVHKYL